MMVGAGTLTPALFAPVEAVHAAATGADEVGTDTDFKVSMQEEGGRDDMKGGGKEGLHCFQGTNRNRVEGQDQTRA